MRNKARYYDTPLGLTTSIIRQCDYEGPYSARGHGVDRWRPRCTWRVLQVCGVSTLRERTGDKLNWMARSPNCRFVVVRFSPCEIAERRFPCVSSARRTVQRSKASGSRMSLHDVGDYGKQPSGLITSLWVFVKCHMKKNCICIPRRGGGWRNLKRTFNRFINRAAVPRRVG